MKQKSRSKKAYLNSLTGLTYEFITIICSMILLKLILQTFGSNYNGITQSINQFLSFVTLLHAGVGAVTKAALYKPLAEDNKIQISRIMRATEIFMHRVALIFAVGLILLATIYPFLVNDEFEWIFTASLVIIIGFGTFVQYYFGITYRMLLEADQTQFIISIISVATTIANVSIAAVLIKMGFGIHVVKLGSAIVFAINTIAINIIVRKNYQIDRKVEPNNSAIKQRWDAFAQQVAMMIRDNTDIVILTVFSNTLEISVYSVFFMIIKSINGILRAFTNGIGAAFGNMLAKNETELIKKNLRIYEQLVFSLSVILYSATCVLITPFVMVYTSGVTDVNYNRPVFGYVLAFAYFFFCIRIPYQNIVEVAGHFKRTKRGAYVESAINLFSSIILVLKFGIVGVAVGTLLSMFVRTIHYAFYVAKNLVLRKNAEFLKKLIISLINMVLIILVCNFVPLPKITSYFTWVISGFLVFITACIITLIFNWVFYREELTQFMKMLAAVIK